MEQGWLLIGMGIRMAYDLGLNCDSSQWKINGHALFTQEETQTRRQIWWTCCMVDRYGSLYMGRPVMIKDGDYDTPLPDIDPVEDRDPWQPVEGMNQIPYAPAPGRILSTLCAVSRLSMIVGAIITKVYPINPPLKESRQQLLAELESRLDQWYYTLPEHLRLDPGPRKVTPPPQILFLHIRYWGAVLLLHRGFIPNWRRMDEVARSSTIGTRAFDLARSAACQMSSIITTYRETFTLRRSSPFLTSYLLSAGIVQVLTLTLRPDDVEASVGLQQLKAALKDMELTWPSAARAWELLNGAHLSNRANTSYMDLAFQTRPKRPAEAAFGQDKVSDYPRQEAFVANSHAGMQPPMNKNNGVQDMSTRMMASMLGLDVPGVEPSTSFFPGYEWWPRPDQMSMHHHEPVVAPITDAPSYSGQSHDPNMLLPMGAPVQNPQLSNPLEQWIPMQNQNAQQPVNGLNLNYAYDFQHYGV
ncbi:nuclear protein [Coprinopsis cinerea AmutBmut pab1-1]|nr:nuclear protein [Coprinopsis cinerea AmutBmut pab1-1]